MGFRFRKSVKMGPFRVNFSKSGVGWSVGGKGYRYTKKANGGSRQTFSVPGTGVSYSKDSSKKRKSSSRTKAASPRTSSTRSNRQTQPHESGKMPAYTQPANSSNRNMNTNYVQSNTNYAQSNINPNYQRPVYTYNQSQPATKKREGSKTVSKLFVVLAAFSAAIVFLSFCNWIGDSDLEKQTQDIPAIAIVSQSDSSETANSTETINNAEPTIDAETVNSNESSVNHTQKEGNTTIKKTSNTTTKKKITTSTKKETATKKKTTTKANNLHNDVNGTVWVTAKGKKYHCDPDCSGMKNPVKITLKEAKAKGYTACSKCY